MNSLMKMIASQNIHTLYNVLSVSLIEGGKASILEWKLPTPCWLLHYRLLVGKGRNLDSNFKVIETEKTNEFEAFT